MHAFTACLLETFTLSETLISPTIIANAIVMVNFFFLGHFKPPWTKPNPTPWPSVVAIHRKFGNVTLRTNKLLWSNGLALAVASTRKFLPTTVSWVGNDEKLANLGGKFCSIKLNASRSKPS